MDQDGPHLRGERVLLSFFWNVPDSGRQARVEGRAAGHLSPPLRVAPSLGHFLCWQQN